MAEENGEKSEEASEFRLEEARRKGQVARSKDLVTSGLMMAAAVSLLMFSYGWTESLGSYAKKSLTAQPELHLDVGVVQEYARSMASCLAEVLLPVMALMMSAAIVLNIAQVGVMTSPEALTPKLSHLNPLQGVKRIVSVQAVAKLSISLGKLLLVTAIAALFVSGLLPVLVGLIDNEWTTVSNPEHGFREREIARTIWFGIRTGVARLAFQLAAALLILGLIDLWFQKWKFRRDMRMTKQEVLDELKNFIGDPKNRQRRDEVRRLIAEARTNNNVETADVVVTNPTHISIALKYDPATMSAPTVVAKGADRRAMLIRQLAAKYGVPMIERKPVAQALYKQVRVGGEIPVDMYEVFVEIMAYIYEITGKKMPEGL